MLKDDFEKILQFYRILPKDTKGCIVELEWSCFLFFFLRNYFSRLFEFFPNAEKTVKTGIL